MLLVLADRFWIHIWQLLRCVLLGDMNIKVAESHKKQTHGDIYEIQLFLQLLSFFRHSCVLFFSQSFQVDVIVLSTSPPPTYFCQLTRFSPAIAMGPYPDCIWFAYLTPDIYTTRQKWYQKRKKKNHNRTNNLEKVKCTIKGMLV